MTVPESNPWQAPPTPEHPSAPGPAYPAYGAPQQYGAPQYGAPQQYGAPPPGWQPQAWAPQSGPPGRVRPTGKAILLFIVTLGIYTYVYNYKVHKEMKEHSGRGIGGGVALLLTLIAGVAMPFVTSAEVGSLYARRGQPEPVRGLTGLWFLLPVIGGYIIMFGAIAAIAVTAEAAAPAGDAGAAGFFVGFLLFVVVAIGGALVWFVKTNGALNRYWESVGGQ